MSSPIRSGIHLPLEEAANALIFGSLKGVTKQSEKSDILTPWKEQDRRSREVMAAAGSVDAAIRRGMYHRAANRERPHLNSREGHTRASRFGVSRLKDDWISSGD